MIHNSIIPGDGGVVVPIEVEPEVYVERIINYGFTNNGVVCICYGNGVFIGVGDDTTNYYSYSTDGIRWTNATLPVSISCQAQSLCYGDGKFVILSGSIGLYSTDGVNWTQVTLPSSKGYYKVCYGNGIFFGVANDYTGTNTAIRSTDGINWTQVTLPASKNWSALSYGAGKFVMLINSSPSVYYSTDGITWKSTSTGYSGWWNHASYGGGKFVAMASNLTGYIYSTDGITWRYNQSPDQVKLNRVWYCLGRFFAMPYNESSVIYYSTDAIAWNKLTMPEKKWLSACSNDNIAVFGIDTYSDKYCLEPTYKELA